MSKPLGHIIVFKDSVTDVPAKIQAMSRRHNLSVKYQYDRAIKGFATTQLTSNQIGQILRENAGTVKRIERDAKLSINATYAATCATSILEGQTLPVYVTTTGVPAGTKLLWSLASVSSTTIPGASASDFVATSGSFLVQSNGTGTFGVGIVLDALTEGTEGFRVYIKLISGTIVAKSPIVYITDVPPTTTMKTYTCTPITTTKQEGSWAAFTVQTTGVTDGTTLYWNVAGVSTVPGATAATSADFYNVQTASTVTSGSFTVMGGYGTFTVALANDKQIDGLKAFVANVRTTSTTGTIVATSPAVVINDAGTTSLQLLPLGICRIGADVPGCSSQLSTGFTTPWVAQNVSVYVIDTGSTSTDLNVVGGYSTFTQTFDIPYDDNGHGTHVAGTIGAINNGRNVAGVAPGVPIYSYKVLDSAGSGTLSGILDGINQMMATRTGPAVCNMSLGGSAISTLDSAVANAVASGIIMCVAAGNNGANATNYSPAREPSAITVGAYDPTTSTLASFSNYGSVVDILAPGVNVLSLVNSLTDSTSVRSLSGTSMATPHVAGAAALYLSANPMAAPADVAAALVARAGPSKLNMPIRLSSTASTAGTTTRGLFVGGDGVSILPF